MAIVRRTKSDDIRDTSASVTSDYGSGCDVTCDSKLRRANHNHHCVLDAANDITTTRTSVGLVGRQPLFRQYQIVYSLGCITFDTV